MCLGTIGRVSSTWDEGGVPMASVSGSDVCLLYTPGVEVGDVLLVHMGFSVERLDEEAAATALELRAELAMEGFRARGLSGNGS